MKKNIPLPIGKIGKAGIFSQGFSTLLTCESYLSPLVTFTRAGSGTYMNSSGNIATASTNEPRYEYDADGNYLGLLLEEARTNLVEYSTDATNFSSIGGGAVTDTGTDIDIFNEVDVASNGATWNGVRPLTGHTVTAGDKYAITVFYKAGTSDKINIFVKNDTDSQQQEINGTVGSIAKNYNTFGTDQISDFIEENLGNYYRTTFVFTVPASMDGDSMSVWVTPYSTVVGETVKLLGVQVEQGAFPTSFIVTGASTVTRPADNAVISGSAFNTLWNPNEGTVLFEGSDIGRSVSVPRVFFACPYSVSSQNRIWFEIQRDENIRIVSASSSASNYDFIDVATSVAIGDPISFAMYYKTGGGKGGSFNGASVVTDTYTAPASPLTQVIIGTDIFYANPYNGHIKTLRYYRRRLPDSQLQGLTS